MKIYRLFDQYYYDKYDRFSIEILKELEAKEAAELAVSTPETRLNIMARHAISPLAFKNRAIALARDRETTVREWMAKDERLDKLVAGYPQPAGICCNTCKINMDFSTHFFDVDTIPLLFLFVCPEGHKPGKTERGSAKVNLPGANLLRLGKRCMSDKFYEPDFLLYRLSQNRFRGK